MNVAFFIDSYYPTTNGVVTVVNQLKTQMEKMGHKAIVITVDAREKKEAYINTDGIYRVPSIESPLPQWKGVFMGFPSTRKIIKILKENNIDLVHVHTEFPMGNCGIKVAKKMKLPVIATTHTMWEDYYPYYFFGGKYIPLRWVRAWIKNFFGKFDALINVSQKANDYFNKSYILPQIPSAIIPNAIDETKFCAIKPTKEDMQALKSSLNIEETDKVLLYTGRLVNEKRIHELYEIAKGVVNKKDNVKVIFVGSGNQEESLRQTCKIDNKESNIIFTGFVPWEKLSVYYSIADIFITCSLSEMHSMTVLEAITLGKPVICRRDTSFTDTIIDGLNGYLCDDDEQMIDTLITIIDDKKELRRLSKNAFDVSKSFTLESQVNKHIKFYEMVISEYPNHCSSNKLQREIDNISAGYNQMIV